MDYGKQSAAKGGKREPRHSEHNAPGSEKKPFGQTGPKAELLARMKAAAERARAAGAAEPGTTDES
jgi:hypothetical protein